MATDLCNSAVSRNIEKTRQSDNVSVLIINLTRGVGSFGHSLCDSINTAEKVVQESKLCSDEMLEDII